MSPYGSMILRHPLEHADVTCQMPLDAPSVEVPQVRTVDEDEELAEQRRIREEHGRNPRPHRQHEDMTSGSVKWRQRYAVSCAKTTPRDPDLRVSSAQVGSVLKTLAIRGRLGDDTRSVSNTSLRHGSGNGRHHAEGPCF